MSIKDVYNGLGVKNMSELVLTKSMADIEKKSLQMNKLKNKKWLKEKFLKSMIT